MEDENETYRLSLRDGPSFVTPAGQVDLETPARNLAPGNETVHLLIQLCEAPTRDDIAVLREYEIFLLGLVANTTFEAVVPRGMADTLASESITPSERFAGLPDEVAARTRWIGTITPALKQQSSLRAGRIAPYGLNADGTLRLLVTFYDDVTAEQAEAVLRGLGLDEEAFDPHASGVWRVRLGRSMLPDLAADDAVKAIEQGPLPFAPLNSVTRALIGIDDVQAVTPPDSVPPNYQGLTGIGIRVAVMDLPIDAEHDDFWAHDALGHRTNLRLEHHPGGAALHGTHVAGIIGANGYQSSRNNALNVPNGGDPFQWRGMAPEATLLSFEIGNFGVGNVEIYQDAITSMEAHLSNHSYIQDCTTYGSTQATIDKLVRGSEVFNGEIIPARPVIWAAGNNGFAWGLCLATGYFSILSSAKNPIVVGGVFANDSSLYSQSSLGPTPDSRIKPDIVAPACNLPANIISTATEEYADEFPDAHPNGYDGDCGTSMAAAAVTGTSALLLQQWRDTFNCSSSLGGGCFPFPSTIKAVLIQTATDLVDDVGSVYNLDTFPANPSDPWKPVVYFEGPDYATGYGLVNASAANALIEDGAGPSGRLVESEIAVIDEPDEYHVIVPVGQGRLRVTLAWDDVPNESIFSTQIEPKLVNDLDLVLVGPSDEEFLPWVLPTLIPALDPPLTGDHAPWLAESIDPNTLQAGPGVDRRNNVEQVEVDSPAAGTWTVRVTAHAILASYGPQKYSLASDLSISTAFPVLPFEEALLPVEEFAAFASRCVEIDWAPTLDGFRSEFPMPGFCGYVPLGPLCRFTLNCPACDRSGYCPAMSLALSDLPEGFRVEIRDQESAFVVREESGEGESRLTWSMDESKKYGIFFFPDGESRPEGVYNIGLRATEVTP